jgi:hypothetical protein
VEYSAIQILMGLARHMGTMVSTKVGAVLEDIQEKVEMVAELTLIITGKAQT